jgi:glycosyltransferase involved in cell wall biosynthesis
MEANRNIEIGVVSTYPPTECGISDYCFHLVEHLKKYPNLKFFLYAINSHPAIHTEEVIYSIERDNLSSYLEAADRINRNKDDIILMQHQFLLYGEDGLITPKFLEAIKKPVVVILHTIPSSPLPEEEKAIKSIGEKAKKIIVMTKYAKRLLEELYNCPPDKVEVIYHPYPESIRLNREQARIKLGIPNDFFVMSTFGLVRKEKGIELAIEALKFLKDEKIIYFILGRTHPNHHRREREAYREKLMRIAKELKVEGMIKWINRFLPTEELSMYLSATDFYVAPYHSREQVSSGPVTYALGSGKIVISTPFPFAREMLGEGRGIIVNYDSPKEIAESIHELMYNNNKRKEIEKKVEKFAKKISWNEAVKKYFKIIEETAT